MMRIQISRDNETRMIKPKDLQRFLERGWQSAQPVPERPSKPKLVPEVKVEATAEVVTEEDNDPELEAPLFSMPTNNQGD